MADTEPSPLARALGRIPSGLFIVTTRGPDDRPLGFVGSFVMQVGFDPPTVCVAVGEGRDHLAAMRSSGRFTLSVLDSDSSGVMGAFFKKLPEGATPYDEVATEAAPSGVTVLAGALAWLDCQVTGEFATGDHVVVFGEVQEGALARAGDPSIHLRRDGLGY